MRHTALLALFLLGLACGSQEVALVAAREPNRDPPCDPISTREPAPAPPDTAAVCGNGVIDAVAGTCVKVCAGGCRTPIRCSVECTTPREICDGREVGFTCESQGYAGGEMACTQNCELDDSGCLACVAGPDVRCGSTPVVGDEVFVVASATGAAVFARDAETGRITGATVSAALRTQVLTNLPSKTLAAGALDGGLGFVDDKRRFGVIDAATGRARILGPIGASSWPILIARSSFEAGGAAVLTGDYMRRTLAIFDPPGRSVDDRPRHFYLSNLRIVVVPGSHEVARGGADLAVIAFGNEVFAYQRDGLELNRLTDAPAGVAFAFTYPAYTDAIRWSSGQMETKRRTDPDTNAPPPGLSRAALSGVSMVAAFGGVLIARPDGTRPRTELYWMAGPDPMAPRVSTAP